MHPLTLAPPDYSVEPVERRRPVVMSATQTPALLGAMLFSDRDGVRKRTVHTKSNNFQRQKTIVQHDHALGPEHGANKMSL